MSRDIPRRPKAIVLMDPGQFADVWGPDELDRLAQVVEVVGPPTRDVREQPRDDLDAVEVVVTGWGAQALDGRVLEMLPRLSIVMHAAGSVRSLGTPEFWARAIPVVSAVEQNTVPTAEFAAAEIVYALKKGWQSALRLKATKDWNTTGLRVPGLNGSIVGLVSLGRVGRYVAERLVSIGSIRVLAYDPHMSAADAGALGVEPVSLEDLFAQADVVSVHTPWIPETTGLVRETLLRSLKDGATLINTARGAIIDENALIRVLRDRPDLFAALDVTYPEPPDSKSPLWGLDNVCLTPHIAGSFGEEKTALARSVLTQLEHFLTGLPIHPVTHEDVRSPAETRRPAVV